MNDIQGYQNGPIETGASRAKEMSPRAYNLVMSALIFLGFCCHGRRCLLYEHHVVCAHDDERRRFARWSLAHLF